jgi:hypothetical protein
MDILERINIFLDESKNHLNIKYIPQENAIQILEYIIDEVKDDKILLNAMLSSIKKEWSISNKSLIENFYNVLSFYGVLGESADRKTILENKGKNIIRKFITLKSKDKITKLL